MKVLVINTGSSSIKYKLFDLTRDSVLASGIIEKIGSAESIIKHTLTNRQGEENNIKETMMIADHKAGLKNIAETLIDEKIGAITDNSEINAVGHRVVHGGETFHRPAILDDEIMEAIKQNVPLAPLHNPANLTGIEVAKSVFPGAKHVGVFDTAFHQTMPESSYMYAIPYEMYEKFKIRRYGFHGTSHHFVALETARYLGKPLEELKIITAHLGNGSSITAVKNGKAIDTTMGMTPLAGLMMGTRSGDLDPAVPFFLAQNNNCTLDRIDTMLNKKSGLYGICGKNDMREIEEMIEAGDEKSKLAFAMLTYQIKKYIGSYIAAMGGCDVISFTAGIGENDIAVRAAACADCEFLGIEIDEAKNNVRGDGIRPISSDSSRIKVMVVPTNEELQIARETAKLLKE